MKEYQSKFRSNRAKKEGEESEPASPVSPTESKGQRAQANEQQAKPDMGQEEALEEQVAPGIHDQVAAKASELHITHDHASGRHHVHVVNEDGTEAHSDHASPEEAHMQAANAAGVMQDGGDPSGNYPQKHKPPEDVSEPDEFDNPNVD